MASKSEMPRITELHVRMDCNGCEHKIRKTLRAIDGVSDVYVDSANQKVTVVGIADPERIVKAIRKTKRVPTIFSHTDPAAPPPPAAAGEAPPPPPPEEAAPAAEPAPEESKEAPPPEESAPATDATVIHMVHDYPYSSHVDHHHHHHMFREHWPAASHPAGSMVGYGGAPYYATHSYSHRPSPYVSEYGYVGSPAHEGRSYYSSHDYYHYPAAAARGKGDGSQITSMFSDENPNACTIA